jgi:hypothetical protein
VVKMGNAEIPVQLQEHRWQDNNETVLGKKWGWK